MQHAGDGNLPGCHALWVATTFSKGLTVAHLGVLTGLLVFSQFVCQSFCCSLRPKGASGDSSAFWKPTMLPKKLFISDCFFTDSGCTASTQHHQSSCMLALAHHAARLNVDASHAGIQAGRTG